MAFWVVSFHTSANGIGPVRITSYGYLAVDVFFLLSGLVLMHAHAGQFRRLSAGAARTFLRQRFWRVYPMCALSVMLAIGALRLTAGHWPDPSQIMGSLLMLEVWGGPNIGLNPPIWSLAVEAIGYLAFPLVAWLLLRSSQMVRGAIGLVLLALTIAVSVTFVANTIYGVVALARMGLEFGLGCVLFFAPVWGRATRRGDAVAILSAIGMSVALLTDQPGLAVGFLPSLVLGVAASAGPVAAALGSRPALFLGRISFALYITHAIVLSVFTALTPRLAGLGGRSAMTAAAIGLTIVVATVLCRVVEEPMRRIGRGPVPRAARAW